MPTLYKQLKKLPWAAVPAVSAVTTDHGRRARRTIKAALAPAWIEFDGAAQVAQLRRTVTKNGKKTVEVVYLITSDRHADPATLAARTGPAARPRGWTGTTLARTLHSTNPVESMIEICRDHSRNVKRWRDGTMALRWCAAGMLEAGHQFRRVNGHMHLPRLPRRAQPPLR